MHTELRREFVKSEEGFTLVQEAFSLESFIRNQNTLFLNSINSKNPEKTQPFQNRRESWWKKKRRKKKKNKTQRMERKSRTQMKFLNLKHRKLKIRRKEGRFLCITVPVTPSSQRK